jgi:hypothetical protein
MNNNKCNYNPLEGKVAVLVSKKRCKIFYNGIYIKKGVSSKNAIIKLRGFVVPKEINTKIYHSLFVDAKTVESIPFYN